MKTLSFVSITCFLLITMYSCRKDDLSKSLPPPPEQDLEGLISTARSFFETNVSSKSAVFSDPWGMGEISRQRIHKTPVWEDAYVATKKNFNVVVVPLKFEKNYTTKQDDNPKHDISLEKQTKLYIYNDGKGDKAVVVTLYPSGDYIDGKTSKFSGYIFVEDWTGNTIHEIGADDGKYYKVSKGENSKKRSSGQQSVNKKLTTYCYYRNHYLCSVDQNGNPYDCVYEYTEWLGCYEEEKYDELIGPEDPGGGGGGGGDFYLEDYQIARSKDWVVAQEPVHHIGEIYGTTRFKGKRNSSEPQGGHFTGVNHQYSICNFCGFYEIWVETTSSASITSAQYATASVTGSLNYIHGNYTLSGSKNWSFSDVF